MTAPIKLARLLLQLCAKRQRTESGVEIRCPYTHQQIGMYLGVSQETVAYYFADLRSMELVEQHGSTLVISSLRALKVYAEQVAC
jgi:CRP-like cAMP-binding protein